MLQNYNVTKLQCYKITKLQNYNVTKLQCYKITKLQNYNVTKLQCYKITMLQNYNVKKTYLLQNYNVKKLTCSPLLCALMVSHLWVLVGLVKLIYISIRTLNSGDFAARSAARAAGVCPMKIFQ